MKVEFRQHYMDWHNKKLTFGTQVPYHSVTFVDYYWNKRSKRWVVDVYVQGMKGCLRKKFKEGVALLSFLYKLQFAGGWADTEPNWNLRSIIVEARKK